MVHFTGTKWPWKLDQRPRSIARMTFATLLLTAAATAAAPDRIPMHAEDLQAARAEAKARNLPLFVDVWAPW